LIFYHTFKAQLRLTDDEKQNEKTLARFNKMIGKLGFTDMCRVLTPIFDSWPDPALQCINEINKTRNAAAHSDNIDQVSYKGRNPFKDADCFAQMYFDVGALRRSMSKYFDRVIEGPKAQLKRYVDKYGPGEL
jgi:hypothetical protein